jgi:hypothetical protein
MCFRNLLDPLRTARSRMPIQTARRSPSRRRQASLNVDTLEDRAVPAAVFSVGDAVIFEGNADIQYAEVVVNLSEPHAQNVSVNYSTVNGSATLNSDFTAASGKLTFAKGETSKTIKIEVRGDRDIEPDESFSVQLSNPTKGARIVDGTGIVTIVDDEPRIRINDVYALEGNSGTTQFTFTVSLSHASNLPVTVDYTTMNGTASAGSDYTANSGTLTFAPEQTSQTITVLVHGDGEAEQNETFTVNLSNASTGTAIVRSVGNGTILNEEPVMSITDALAYGGESSLTFAVSLTYASNEPVTVNYTTADYTALAGVDYVAQSGVLTFDPGQTVQYITVDIIGDVTSWGDKWFTVQLSGTSANATLATDTAYGYYYYGWGYYDYGGYDYGYYYYDYYGYYY